MLYGRWTCLRMCTNGISNVNFFLFCIRCLGEFDSSNPIIVSIFTDTIFMNVVYVMSQRMHDVAVNALLLLCTCMSWLFPSSINCNLSLIVRITVKWSYQSTGIPLHATRGSCSFECMAFALHLVWVVIMARDIDKTLLGTVRSPFGFLRGALE